MKTTFRGACLVLAASLLFSTSGTLQALGPEGTTPYSVACMRMLVGAAALLVWCLARGIRPLPGRWRIRPLLVWAVALLGFQVFFFRSTLVVGVAIGTVVAIGSTPILAGLLSWILKGERPPRVWYPATALAIAGLVLVNTIEAIPFGWTDLLQPLLAGGCYAVELSVSKDLADGQPPEVTMAAIMAAVGLALLPVAALQPMDWVLTGRGIFVVVGLGVFNAACAFTLLLAGMKETSATVGSTLALGEPMGAALLGILFLGEPWSVASATGIALILASILLLVLGGRGQ